MTVFERPGRGVVVGSGSSLGLRGARMVSAGSSSGEARRLADRLVGRPIPSVLLGGFDGSAVNLCELADAFGLVIYLWPGCASSPSDGEQTSLMDAAQHRAFGEHQRDLEARQYRVIGISSQSQRSQRQSALEHAVAHMLLSDPELQLARELELPTFELDAARWYQRLTLVASGGRIEKAFFPVSSAAHSAAQVIAWLSVQGIS
jgi:peroxiredoxin